MTCAREKYATTTSSSSSSLSGSGAFQTGKEIFQAAKQCMSDNNTSKGSSSNKYFMKASALVRDSDRKAKGGISSRLSKATAVSSFEVVDLT